jgi:hypothetical protein
MKKTVKSHPIGRPSLYKPEYAQQLIDYFNIEAFTEKTVILPNGLEKTERIANKFPTLARFATMVGVTRETLHDWATSKDENERLKYPEFSYAYKRAKDYQEYLLVEGTVAGVFNAPFAIFSAKNILGWRDKTEQEITGAAGGPLLMQVATDNDA